MQSNLIISLAEKVLTLTPVAYARLWKEVGEMCKFVIVQDCPENEKFCPPDRR